MVWKIRYQSVAIWCVAGCFICLLYLSVISLPNISECCQCQVQNSPPNVLPQTGSRHKLAVIIPFRNRFEELQEFIPYMHNFLQNQKILHEFIVVNQVDNYRFNRASLINVGYVYAKNSSGFDYLAMHDVDLVPTNRDIRYEYPNEGRALHISGPKLHPKYHYETFVGGILILTMKDFFELDGLSNKYWGWGLEDDEFYLRMKQKGIEIIRPDYVTTGPNNTFRHIHDIVHRVRDKERCFDQKAATRKRDRLTGLHDVDYRLLSRTQLSINSASALVLNVALHCNRTITPWCHCS